MNGDNRMFLDHSFLEYRLRNLNLKRAVHEVNFIYKYKFHQFKCLSTPTVYFDLATNQDTLTENYEKAKTYLEDNGYSYLLEGENSLHELYYHNRIAKGNDIEIQTVKSLDKLIKSIKNEVNR